MRITAEERRIKMRKTVEEMSEKLKKEYRKRTTPRKMLPIFSRSCKKCGDEIRLESMWEIGIPKTSLFCNESSYYYGCKKCFPRAADFYEKMNEDGYINEGAWIYSIKPSNVSLKDWALLSGYLKEEDLKQYKELDLLKEYCHL